MTSFETHRDAALGRGLLQLADDWKDKGREARAAFMEKADTDKGWDFQGGFGYALGWDQGHVVKEELKTGISLLITKLMVDPEDGEPATPDFVLTVIDKQLNKLIRSGVETSSTSETSNLVARLMGKAAVDILDRDYEGLGRIRFGAAYEAMDELIGEESRAYRRAGTDVNDLEAKLDRAKAESSKARITADLEEAKAWEVKAARLYVATADTVGVPRELLLSKAVDLVARDDARKVA